MAHRACARSARGQRLPGDLGATAGDRDRCRHGRTSGQQRGGWPFVRARQLRLGRRRTHRVAARADPHICLRRDRGTPHDRARSLLGEFTESAQCGCSRPPFVFIGPARQARGYCLQRFVGGTRKEPCPTRGSRNCCDACWCIPAFQKSFRSSSSTPRVVRSSPVSTSVYPQHGSVSRAIAESSTLVPCEKQRMKIAISGSPPVAGS